MVIAGIMSGSSLDGLDIAIVRFQTNNEWELLWHYAVPYSEEWEDRLKNYHLLSSIEYISLKSEYSRYTAELLEIAFREYSGNVDFISFHGHTLMHLPEKGITEQIGNGGVIAAVLNIPAITDFRVQDIIKGGVGTPLAPLVELNLFQGHDYYLNLGGIANLTIINQGMPSMAYDVCPCNQVLNYYSNLADIKYDKDGDLARKGSMNDSLFLHLNSEPYFNQKPPKSLDNNWIVNSFIPSLPPVSIEDGLHTFCHWMAECISNEVEQSEDETTIMVSGGGAHNIYFMECLRESLSFKNCILKIPPREIIDYKEAILMSLMAYKYLKDEINVLSNITGASSNTIGGALYKVP